MRKIEYKQSRRMRGITKNNFYTLYDLAMLGITNLSKVPLRLVIFCGFVSAMISMFLGMFYFVYKLVYWNSFSLGVAPLVLGLFFLGSVQLLAAGHHRGIRRLHPYPGAKAAAGDRKGDESISDRSIVGEHEQKQCG